MKLIFLSYINRSGSTFFCQEISKYSDVFVFPEADALIDKFLLHKRINKSKYLQLLSSLFKKDEKLKNWGFNKRELSYIVEQKKYPKEIFFEILEIFKNRYKPNAEICIFKKRDAFIKKIYIEKVLDIPVSLICLVRDPRAIYCSQKMTIDYYKNKPFNINPLVTSYYWIFFLKNIIRVDTLAIIRYEDLINKKHNTINNILDKIGSDKKIDNNNLLYTNILSSRDREMHTNISLPPQTDFIEKWKSILKKNEIMLINNICKDFMLQFNYTSCIYENIFSVRYYLLYVYYKLRIFFKIDLY